MIRPLTAVGARIAGGVLLLAAIAVASSARTESGRVEGTSFRFVLFVAIGTGIALLAVAGLVLSAYAAGAERSRRTRAVLLSAATTLLVVFALFVWLVPEHYNFYTGGGRGACPQTSASWYEKRGYDQQTACASDTSGAGKVSGAAGGGKEPDRHLLAAVAGATLLILIVGGSLLATVLRRRRSVIDVEGDKDDAVLHAVDESLDDLRRERDVRRAIVACYSRMEGALARSGTPRQPHEAPLEFLVRVLERVARDPGHSLTDLFERAKFSAEPMGASEKEQAIAALEALRAGLA